MQHESLINSIVISQCWETNGAETCHYIIVKSDYYREQTMNALFIQPVLYEHNKM